MNIRSRKEKKEEKKEGEGGTRRKEGKGGRQEGRIEKNNSEHLLCEF